MANPDRAIGFRPVKSLLGAPWTGHMRRIQVGDASGDTTNAHGNIYIGDPIKYSSGKALAANSGDAVLGVVVAVGEGLGSENAKLPVFPTNLEKRYILHTDTSATAEQWVWYVPAEGALFEIQSASDLDLALGAEADFSIDANEAHGSTTTGYSNAELVADSNSDVVVVEIPGYPDNDSTLANTRYHVRFRNTVHMAPMPTS